jgi:hypothetical protein
VARDSSSAVPVTLPARRGEEMGEALAQRQAGLDHVPADPDEFVDRDGSGLEPPKHCPR